MERKRIESGADTRNESSMQILKLTKIYDENKRDTSSTAHALQMRSYSPLLSSLLFCSTHLFSSRLPFSPLLSSCLFSSCLFSSCLLSSCLFCSLLVCSVLFLSALFLSVLFLSVLFSSCPFSSCLFSSLLHLPYTQLLTQNSRHTTVEGGRLLSD